MDASLATETEPIRGFDWTGFETVGHAVVETVADATGADALDIEPLYATIDPRALDELLSRPTYDEAPADSIVQFRYQGYRVALCCDGSGYLFDAESDTGSRRLH